jgi:hypothetical protein
MIETELTRTGVSSLSLPFTGTPPVVVTRVSLSFSLPTTSPLSTVKTTVLSP